MPATGQRMRLPPARSHCAEAHGSLGYQTYIFFSLILYAKLCMANKLWKTLVSIFFTRKMLGSKLSSLYKELVQQLEARALITSLETPDCLVFYTKVAQTPKNPNALRLLGSSSQFIESGRSLLKFLSKTGHKAGSCFHFWLPGE